MKSKKNTLKFVLRVVHNIASHRIPGFAVLLPIDALLAIVDAVSVGMEKPLKVDWKFSDLAGLMKLLRELMDAARDRAKREMLEFIYELLCYITDVETYFPDREEFIKKADTAANLLPSCDVFPDVPDDDDEEEEVCVPVPTVSV